MRTVHKIDVMYVDGKETEYSRVGRSEQMYFDINKDYNYPNPETDTLLLTVGGHEYEVYMSDILNAIQKLKEK